MFLYIIKLLYYCYNFYMFIILFFINLHYNLVYLNLIVKKLYYLLNYNYD